VAGRFAHHQQEPAPQQRGRTTDLARAGAAGKWAGVDQPVAASRHSPSQQILSPPEQLGRDLRFGIGHERAKRARCACSALADASTRRSAWAGVTLAGPARRCW
jgi:hypothetical protein